MKTKAKPGMKKFIVVMITSVVLATVYFGCEDELKDKTFLTTEGVLMGNYFKMKSDTFGEFYKILEKTNSVSFLNAYGKYTCFAPVNQAVTDFYHKNGKTSVNDFTTREDIDLLKQIVRYHLCPDSISTSMFTTGGLPDTTMSGDYLITTFEEGGINNIKVNNEAYIIKRDITVINGIIHGIDKVLNPIVYSLAEFIDNNPRYSIFAEALKQTGLYDTLNMKSFRYTVFAETDSVLSLNGIETFSDLFQHYSQTGEPYLNPVDSLYIWTAYHCIPQNLFLSDLQNITYDNLTHSLLITVNKGTEIVVNETPVNIALSNNTAKNGVLHSLNGIIEFIAIPVAVYWEFTDRPELRALTDFFRKKSIPLIPGPELPNGISGFNVAPGDTWKYGYQTGHTFRDYFEYSFSAANNRLWFEFETPALVKGGTYKIWVCGKSVAGNRATADVYWDGELVSRMNMGVEGSGTDEEMEAKDKKYYSTPQSPQFIGYLIGTYTITTDGGHKLKFTMVTEGPYTIDMVHFIPENDNQTAVKFPRG